MSGRKAWVLVLAVWFLLWGILQITNVRFDLSGFILGFLAVTVAVLAAMDK